MPHYSAKQIWLALISTLLGRALAIPTVAFPINSQLPPVAYVSQPFNFTFSSSTFTSDTTDISYVLSNQPEWLFLDGNARTLSGTPTPSDVGALNFEVIASDSNGQTSLNVTLIVLQQRVLSVSDENILAQLASAGPASAPTTLLLYPQQTFAFSFAPDVFEGISGQTTFYATSSDGSPLPSWIQFDGVNIRFSGITPPLLSPQPSQQVFWFELAATNIVGFSEARTRLELLISSHVLAFTQTSFNFTATRTSSFRIPSFLNELQLDNSSVRRDQIASAISITPSWLSFNDTDLSFSGTVPSNAEAVNFTLTVNGIQSNSANTTITINIEGQPDSSRESLGNASAIGGSYFSYTVRKPYDLENSTTVAVSSGSLPTWLSFSAANLTLQGLVPENSLSTTEVISFTFTSETVTRMADLNLNISQAGPPSTTSVSGSTTTSNTGAGQTSVSPGLDDQTSLTGKRLAILILAIVVPVIVVVGLVGLIIYSMRKRRRQQGGSTVHGNEKDAPQPPANGLEADSNKPLAMSGGLGQHNDTTQVGNSIPQVELLWAPDSLRRNKERLSKKPRNSTNSNLGLGWDDLMDFSGQLKDNTSLRRFSFRRGRKGSDITTTADPSVLRTSPQRPARPVRPTSLYTQRPSEMSRVPASPRAKTKSVTSELDRLSGAGHGSGGDPTARPAEPRASWLPKSNATPRHDSKSSAAVMNSFPAPPHQTSMVGIEGRSRERDDDNQKTVRIVENDKHVAPPGDGAPRRASIQTMQAQAKGIERLPDPTRRGSAFFRRSPTGELARFPSLYKLAEANSQDAKGKGVIRTPPIPQKSQARQRASHTENTDTRPYEPRGSSRISRVISTASSRQFDSALSSDSHWEDQDLVADSITAESASRTSKVQRSLSRDQAESGPHQPRLADQRQHVNIQSPGLGQSEKSQKGSFRFI